MHAILYGKYIEEVEVKWTEHDSFAMRYVKNKGKVEEAIG